MVLTEQFINLCCVVLFDDNPKFTETVINEINFILSSYNEEDVAIQFKPKFQLAKTLVKLRLEKKNSEYIIDTIVSGGHYTELESYIKGIEKRKIEGDRVQSALDQISERRQTTFLSQDLPALEEFSKKLKTNSFTTAKEAIGTWTGLISKFHSRVLDQKRKEARAAIKELDLASDSYNEVINQISLSYSGQNSVSTGYKELNKLMNGGFEPTRLYIYGGTSGDGKSVLLVNFLKNAVESSSNSNNGPLNVFTYYTLENLIDESLVRLYCNIVNEKVTDLISQFDEKKTKIERTLKEWQLDHHSIIVMSYFPPTLTSVSDLLSYSELIKLRYGSRAVLKATYVDYLDLLKSGQTFDLHRLEMGQVTIDMKVAAVMQGIPWISVTQLNRGAYNDKEEVSLANMSESLKKVEHSDHVALIKNKVEEKDERDIRVASEIGQFKISIAKNRSGPKNVHVNMKSHFAKFRIFDDNSPDYNPLFPISREEAIPNSVF
jgi:replicative DNA helicase